MSAVDCLPGYSWYVCTSPGREYRGCCSIDACHLGCDSKYQQENARTPIGSPTMTTTAASRRTITSTIRVPLKSSSISSSVGDTSLTTLSTFSTSTISISTSETLTSTKPANISEIPTSTSASMVSGTSREGADTTNSISGARDLDTPAIVGVVVGGLLGSIALSLLGYWVFRQLRKARTNKDSSQVSTQSSVHKSSSPIPEPTRVLETAGTVTIHSGPSTSPQTSPSPPPTIPLQPAELPGSPPPTAPQAPLELPLEQNPVPRVSIYDPSTLAMTIHREAVVQVPRRALALSAGNPHLPHAARRRSNFEPTGPLPATTRTIDNLNARGFGSSVLSGIPPNGSGGNLSGGRFRQREVENLSTIRHLSWRDWEEQGIYMSRGPSAVAPLAGGQGNGAGEVGGGWRGAFVGGGRVDGNRSGQSYSEEAQPEDGQGDAGRAAPHPGERYSY
ncbi:hypothetical protein HOY80DRAFT_994806 [Tuber brumale]|nr:hypothetical protein HOY80DRAFT_994806 [Tuber brumale]